MKTTLPLTTLIFLLNFFSYGQDAERYFSDVLQKNFPRYKSISENAYRRGDAERGEFVFDTLVNNQLLNTTFDDYTLKRVRESNIKLSSIKKPIFIQTFISWSVLNKGEISALNKLSKKNAKTMKIIVLFWDRKRSLKDIYPQFSSNIEVCYANEFYRKDDEIIKTLKYSMGYIVSYYLDENLKVIGIDKGPATQVSPKTPLKEAITKNFDAYNTRVSIMKEQSKCFFMTELLSEKHF